MKKILLLICISILGLTEFAQAQSTCSAIECGNNLNPSRVCRIGGGSMSCNRLASPLPNQQWGGCGWTCPEDPPPPTTNLPNSQKEEAKKEESESPCNETYIPPTTTRNPVISWSNFMAQFTNQPSAQPQRAYPIAGPTNSFRTGTGIVAGDNPCKWEDSPEEVEFNTCTEALRPKNNFPNWPAIYAKCKSIHRDSCGDDTACLEASKNYPEPGKMVCKKTSASVIDALWGFLTHRKPY